MRVVHVRVHAMVRDGLSEYTHMQMIIYVMLASRYHGSTYQGRTHLDGVYGRTYLDGVYTYLRGTYLLWLYLD